MPANPYSADLVHPDWRLRPECMLHIRRVATCALLDELPPHFRTFDMATFTDSSTRPCSEQCRTSCGARGCFAGIAPYAGVVKYTHETWPLFAARLIGRNFTRDSDDVRRSTCLSRWLFAPEWSTSDNTLGGAGRRALWILTQSPTTAQTSFEDVRRARQAVGVYHNWTPPQALYLSRAEYDRLLTTSP